MSSLLWSLEMGVVRPGCAVIFAMAALALGGCAAEDEPKPTAASCKKLRDHMVDLRFGAVPVRSAVSKKRAAEERKKHRKTLQASLDRRLVPECMQTMSAAQVECALQSKSASAVAGCHERYAEGTVR